MSWLYVRADFEEPSKLRFSSKIRNREDLSFAVNKDETEALYKKVGLLLEAITKVPQDPQRRREAQALAKQEKKMQLRLLQQ